VHDATTDRATIERWWKQHPDASIALAMGHGRVALDVDEHDPSKSGKETLARMVAEHGELPHTPRARTRGGGLHFVFAIDRALRKAVPGDGLELLGDAHYIIVEPSQGYAWEVYPTEPLAPLPAWLLPTEREPPPHARGEASAGPTAGDGLLFHAFKMRGWVNPKPTNRERKEGVWFVQCPQENLHSLVKRFDSSTVLYAPDREGELGALNCLHAHCENLTAQDVLAFFSAHELAQARAAAGIVDRGKADFALALRMLNDGASRDDIVAAVLASSGRSADYARTTVEKATQVHDGSLTRATIIAVWLEARRATDTQSRWAALKLTLATLDGELDVLPKAHVVLPLPGYESSRPRFEAVAGDLDIERLVAGDKSHAEQLVGREVECVVEGRKVKWIRRL
jgi:hypothetical protein